MNQIGIFIVEDDKITSLLISKILEKNKYKILGLATSGEEAIEKCATLKPDLVLMDIYLDGKMDGVQTGEKISLLYETPIIFVSSYGEHKPILEAKMDQPFSFILKPINEKELITAIQLTVYKKKLDLENLVNQRQFEMLANYSPDIISLTDLNKKKNIYINKSELFGYPHDEFQSLTISDLFLEEDIKRIKWFWKQVVRSYGKQPPSIELQIRCKEKDKLQWINIRQAIIENNTKNGSRLVLTVMSNIEDKKNAELQLIKTNFELDNFIYRSSHDLNAPLKTVLGLVNLIKMEQDKAKIDQYLDLIHVSVTKMDNYIFDMTNFARNNRMEIDTQIINFELIYQAQLNILKDKEGYSSIQKIFSLNQTAEFASDNIRISILINNLLSNAIKFQNTNRTDSFVKITINVNQNHAKIIINDNGLGIKRQYLEKIFDIFYKATENSNGSGLGLYIVKQISKKLGGTVEIESEFSIGTTVTVTIPNRLKIISRY